METSCRPPCTRDRRRDPLTTVPDESSQPRRSLLLGFDFGGTKLALALADPDGDILAARTLPTLTQQGAEAAVDRALRAAHAFVAAEHAVVRSVGVSTMGITHEDHVELAPNVPGWHRLRLPERIRDSFAPAPVAVGNDVKAAALAELIWGELQGVDSGIYVNLGTGVAAALIVSGHVLDGSHGAAGEIGYWLRSRAWPAGARDGHAPLEEHIGGAGTTRRARAEFGVAHGIADLVRRDDAAARAFLADLYDDIAVQVTNLAIALDPQRVVLGGGYTRTPEPLLEAVQTRVERYAPFPPDVRVARFRADAGLAGAIALARQALHGR
jgi:predicted NBD/HSP70 family sugar kinase